jgi:long-chain acyl-CoA synthetase
MVADTLHGMFIESARRSGTRTAYIHRDGGQWRHVSYADALARVERIGAGLMALGVKPGDRVAILSMSRLEWSLTDWATLGAGATVVPIYQTNSPTESQYILDNSNASVVFVEDASQLAKVREVRSTLPNLAHVIVYDTTGLTLDADAGERSLADLEASGTDTKAWRDAGEQVQRDSLATIIYTSGTTGPPKGCMLSHHNYVHMTGQVADRSIGLFSDEDRVVLFLPLAHTFARATQFAAAKIGAELAFTTIATLMDDLGEL